MRPIAFDDFAVLALGAGPASQAQAAMPAWFISSNRTARPDLKAAARTADVLADVWTATKPRRRQSFGTAEIRSGGSDLTSARSARQSWTRNGLVHVHWENHSGTGPVPVPDHRVTTAVSGQHEVRVAWIYE